MLLPKPTAAIQGVSNGVNRAIEKGKHLLEPGIKEIIPIHTGIDS